MDKEMNTDIQQIAMVIIANSGEAKGLAFQALRELRKTKDIDKAREYLKEANKYLHEGHVAQTELLTLTAQGAQVDIDVLIIHAQDHLMTTMIATELIEEMIEIFGEK